MTDWHIQLHQRAKLPWEQLPSNLHACGLSIDTENADRMHAAVCLANGRPPSGAKSINFYTEVRATISWILPSFGRFSAVSRRALVRRPWLSSSCSLRLGHRAMGARIRSLLPGAASERRRSICEKVFGDVDPASFDGLTRVS